MYRVTLLVAGLATLGCSSYQLGHCRSPVASSSRSRVVVAGIHADIIPHMAALRVRAVHLCDVQEREERESGATAERLLPSTTQDAQRTEKDRDASRLGPITTGMMRGEDDAGMQHRTLSNEVAHGLNSPWLLAAASGALAQQFLNVHSRVAAKIDGESHAQSRQRLGVPCQEHPYEGALVALALREDAVDVGRTDDQGELDIELSLATARWGTETRSVDVLVEGERIGAIGLGPLTLSLR